MTIEELNKELKDAEDNLQNNWNKNQDVNECFPEIVLKALDNFRESIIKYLKNNK